MNVRPSTFFFVDLLTMSTPTIPYTIVSNGQGTVYDWQSDAITVRLTGAQTQGLFTLTEDAMKPTFKLLSVSEKNVRRCFLNNSSQERARDLRVSPIDRGL